MKIIFFGTPDFALNTMKYLVENNKDIVALVTSPDKKKGRGNKISVNNIKIYAQNQNIPVYQPFNLKDSNFINTIKDINAELFVVVAFRMLPKEVWTTPSKGTINLHTSMLPNYRGAAPINRVLINNEKSTGVTTFFINEKMDAGEIIMQKEILLTSDTTAGQLHNICLKEGKKILNSSIEKIAANKINSRIQSTSQVLKTAPKLTKDLTKIDWSKSAKNIHDLIRGLSPYIDDRSILKDTSICPSAWFYLKYPNGSTRRIKIQHSTIEKDNSGKNLSILTDNSTFLKIILNDSALSILHLQPEGKSSMNISDFLNGTSINSEFKVL